MIYKALAELSNALTAQSGSANFHIELSRHQFNALCYEFEPTFQTKPVMLACGEQHMQLHFMSGTVTVIGRTT